MTELFIPRQGRNLSPRPLQGLPRLRPGESVRCLSVPSPATRQGSDAATGPGELAAAPPAPLVRRGGPRHGRRTNGGPWAPGAGAAPILAGAAGLVLGLCLGAAGWVVCAQEPKDPGLGQREPAAALREARLEQLQRFAGLDAATRSEDRSR